MASRPVPRCEVRSSELAPGRRWQVTYLDAMADGSGIEWTEATWNPTTGCDESAPAATTPSAGWRPRRLRDHRHRPGPGSLRAVEPAAHPGPLRPPRPGRRRPTRPIAEGAQQASEAGGRMGGNLQPPTTGSVRHHGAPRSLAQDPLNGLLSVEVGGVKPPAQVSEAISHRGPQLFVALEEELLLGRTDLVAVPARVATRIEDDEQ